MVYESMIIGWLVNLWHLLGRLFAGSLTASLFKRLGNRLKLLFSGSAIVKIISREGWISRAWYSSEVYRFIKRLFELAESRLTFIDNRFSSVLKSSAAYNAVKWLSARTHIFTGLFLAGMLVVPHSRWNNIYSTIAVAALLFLLLLRVMTHREAKFHVKALDVFLFIFILSVVLAEVFSLFPGLSLRFFIFYMTCFLLVFLLPSSIGNTRELVQTVGVILLGVALCGLYGVYQGIKGVPVIPSQIDLNLNEGLPGRAYSTLNNANNFAEVLMMMLPFAAAAFLNARHAISKLFFLGLALPPLIALFMTLSRSSWIGLAIAILIFIFFKNKKLIPLLIIAAVICIPFLPQSIYKRILTITNANDTSTSYRFSIYSTVWPMFKNYWVTGIGLGTDTFKQVVQNYYLGYTKGLPPIHSHNVTLQVWFETGLIGMLSFIGYLLGLVKKGIKAIASSSDFQAKNIILAGISSIIGIMTVSMAEYVWFYPRVMLVFWAVIGLTAAALKLARQEGQKQA